MALQISHLECTGETYVYVCVYIYIYTGIYIFNFNFESHAEKNLKKTVFCDRHRE